MSWRRTYQKQGYNLEIQDPIQVPSLTKNSKKCFWQIFVMCIFLTPCILQNGEETVMNPKISQKKQAWKSNLTETQNQKRDDEKEKQRKKSLKRWRVAAKIVIPLLSLSFIITYWVIGLA